MKTKTNIKAGMISIGNHNEIQVRDTKQSAGLRVKTRVKAGGFNHNETQVRDTNQSAGLRVKTRVKAGGFNHNETQVRDTN